jgi:hypothetical protein
MRLGNRPEDDLLDAACIHLTGMSLFCCVVFGDAFALTFNPTALEQAR